MIRTLGWAVRARVAARRASLRSGFRGIDLPPAPRTGLGRTRYVHGVLGVSRSTCLVESVVMQEWYATHGEYYDVVIGVTSPSSGFRAHAWLDKPGNVVTEFTELTRVPARAGVPPAS